MPFSATVLPVYIAAFLNMELLDVYERQPSTRLASFFVSIEGPFLLWFPVGCLGLALKHWLDFTLCFCVGCVGLGSGFSFGVQIPIATAIYDCLRVRGSEVPLFSFAIIFDHRCLAHRSVLRSMGFFRM